MFAYFDVNSKASPNGSRLQHKDRTLPVLHNTEDEADKPDIFFDLLKNENVQKTFTIEVFISQLFINGIDKILLKYTISFKWRQNKFAIKNCFLNIKL